MVEIACRCTAHTVFALPVAPQMFHCRGGSLSRAHSVGRPTCAQRQRVTTRESFFWVDVVSLKAGHRSTLAFLRFCVIAATGIRKHTQVELFWSTRRIRRISAFPSNSERLDAIVFTPTLPATGRNSRTISTRATDVIF